MPYKRFQKIDYKNKTKGSRKLNKLVFVSTEGQTEREYLKFLNNKLRDAGSQFSIRFIDTNHTDPLGIVNDTVREKNNNMIDGNSNTYWCIVDVDEHPSIGNALAKAGASEINILYSNQNFEIWLLFHFVEKQAFMDRDDCVSELKKHMQNYKKTGIDFSSLNGKYSVAKKRAISMIDRHRGNGTKFPHDNPVSYVYQLVEFVGLDY